MGRKEKRGGMERRKRNKRKETFVSVAMPCHCRAAVQDFVYTTIEMYTACTLDDKQVACIPMH